MVLNGIRGLQEKSGGDFIVPAMSAHAESLASGYKGYQELRSEYGVTRNTPAARNNNTLG